VYAGVCKNYQEFISSSIPILDIEPAMPIRHAAVDLVLLAGLDGLPGGIVPVIREAGQGQRHRGPRRLSPREVAEKPSQVTLWYPLVKLWKITIFNRKIHYQSPFSIAMLNYQRVPSGNIYRP